MWKNTGWIKRAENLVSIVRSENHLRRVFAARDQCAFQELELQVGILLKSALYRGLDMAGATALDIAGHHLVSSSGVCPVLFSRSYFFRGLGRNRSASLSSTKNSVSCGPARRYKVQALLLEPSDGAQENLDDFVKRMEQTWSITKQPRPVQCKSCRASGQVDCPWCNGTGFFTIGDNVLCEVPSRNTTCRVCFGRCTLPCDDCKGTGFRAKWLGDPEKPNRKEG